MHTTNKAQPQFSTCIVQNFLGDHLEVIEDDYISNEIIKNGAYARHELAIYSALFGAVTMRNCLEIGGNIGNHTSLFSRYFTHTYTFEPNPLVFDILQGNIQRNGMRATAYRYGISNKEDFLDFYIDRNNLGASSFIKGELKNATSIIQTKVRAGDNVVEQEGIRDIDYIKIDAEGFEGKIVQSLQKIIEKHQPLISLEWKSATTRNDFSRYALFETVLGQYTPLAISRHFPLEDYNGPLKRIQRTFLKHIFYRNQKKKLHFLPFYSHGSYSMVFFFPKRFIHLANQRLALSAPIMANNNK